ncbi:MAG: right-handed parallel beta-helix repeat-containing protein [Candidatus Thermoplasmatota archaeon]|nr:right-handed parallel beta-helix repeat-containing protein [Candidatus Thermoplasmatota archaeon]
MKREYIVIGIILLFLGACLLPTAAQNIEKKKSGVRGNWLYVGGSGPGNYSKIQDAIDNASNGDTVFVYPGTYPEHIEIQHSITLHGSDPLTTRIDGKNTSTEIVKCTAAGSVITGFSVFNCSLYRPCILINNTANCTVTGNIFHTSGYGIRLRNSQNISIIQNTITNTRHGISDSMNELHTWTNKYLTIQDNVIKNISQGIHLLGSTDYTLTGNTIDNATSVGIYIAEDIMEGPTPRNITINENIITSSRYGIEVDYAINATITGNKIQQNTLALMLKFNSFTSVENNTFEGNTDTILYRWALFPLSSIQTKIPHFDNNYWEKALAAPKPIFGRWGLFCFSAFFEPIHPFPWMTFDWHPAQEPYVIAG